MNRLDMSVIRRKRISETNLMELLPFEQMQNLVTACICSGNTLPEQILGYNAKARNFYRPAITVAIMCKQQKNITNKCFSSQLIGCSSLHFLV